MDNKPIGSCLGIILSLCTLVSTLYVLDKVNYQQFVEGHTRRAIKKGFRQDMFPVLLFIKDKTDGELTPVITLYHQAVTHMELNSDYRLAVPMDKVETINSRLATHPVEFVRHSFKGKINVRPLPSGKQLIQVIQQWNEGWNSTSGWYVTDGKSISPKYQALYFRYNYTLFQLISALIGNIAFWIIFLHLVIRRTQNHTLPA